MNIQPEAGAYLEAISYKFHTENNAKIIKMNEVLGIQYPQLQVQPWPRQFNYRLEFFTGANPPSHVKTEINKFLKVNPEEYVVNVISDKLEQLIPAYKGYGYLHAWSNIIMSKNLSSKEKLSLPPGVEIKRIETIQDVSLVNSIDPDYPCSTVGLADSVIQHLMAFYNGKICAKAEMVFAEGKYVFIADIFTHPDFRRRGISTGLMQTMHKIALDAGKSTSILVPSKMTSEFDLFGRLNYKSMVEFALLVPEQGI